MSNPKRPHSISEFGPSLTKQSFKDQCDINVIMKKYEQSGQINHLNKQQGAYGDFTGVSDYQSTLNSLINAQNAFYSLPAEVRKEFGNDPGKLIAFIENDANYEQAYKLGILSEDKYLQTKSKLTPKDPPLTSDPK